MCPRSKRGVPPGTSCDASAAADVVIVGAGMAGLGFGAIVVSAIDGLGFSTVTIPTGQIAGLVVTAAIAGLIAAVAPACRVARLDILDAIAYQ